MSLKYYFLVVLLFLYGNSFAEEPIARFKIEDRHQKASYHLYMEEKNIYYLEKEVFKTKTQKRISTKNAMFLVSLLAEAKGLNLKNGICKDKYLDLISKNGTSRICIGIKSYPSSLATRVDRFTAFLF